MSQSHCRHRDTPERHDDRNEDAGTKALEQDVGQGLEEGVGDEEDGEAGIVLAAGDVQGFLQAIKFGVADIGAVEEGDEVEKAEPWDQAEIELP